MATIFHPSATPPPPSSLHTPTTPRFGFDDSYEPYSPRKSTRVASQRLRVTQTPPPQTHTARASKRSTSSNLAASPPSSPPTASKKRTPRTSPNMGGRRVSGALSHSSTASAAAALGLSLPTEGKMEVHRSTAATRNNAMLPTPAKTPKKRPSETAPGITAIARNLFPVRAETVEEVMPSPKKKGRKRYTGFTLDSFEAEEGDPIQIYTDSHDRVPEVDMSTENPFYGESSVARREPTKRASKRRKITVPGEGEQTVEEAEQREDGLVYVFRGKKIFRKFADEEETGSQAHEEGVDDTELSETVPATLRRPLTRSSIKPRLLFPTPQQSKAKAKRSQAIEDEEEAVTDIDEPNTPMELHDDVVETPKAPRFAPASPPTTVRTTRSKKIDMSSSPAGPASDDDVQSPTVKGGKLSPFDGWQRTKKSTGGSKKREGASLTKGPSGKKVRGSV